MTPLIITITLLAIAAAGVWGWIRNSRARELAEKGASEKSERRAAEKEPADEKAAAEAKDREDAPLQAEAEEQSRKEAGAREDARLAQEQHQAEERAKEDNEARGTARLAGDEEARRVAETKALAEAQARELAGQQADELAKQQAEAEAPGTTRTVVEQGQRVDERHQDQQRARAEREERDRAPLVAEHETRRRVHANIPEERTITPPAYRPPTPPTSPQRRSTAPDRPQEPTHRTVDVRLRVQLVFRRDGAIRGVALVANRHKAMPDELEVTGTQGELRLACLREDCYEPATLTDASNELRQGAEWHGRGNARRWRWVLGGRDLYVLAPGDHFGLHGFVSTPRLWLNARHVVLARAGLADTVLAALTEAECPDRPELRDRTSLPGWVVFKDVVPKRATPRREGDDPLEGLSAHTTMVPVFDGGILLRPRTWIAGHPPQIRFKGKLDFAFRVTIDGKVSNINASEAYVAPGWDTPGEHTLEWAGHFRRYRIEECQQSWTAWPAHLIENGYVCGCIVGDSETDNRSLELPDVSTPAADLVLKEHLTVFEAIIAAYANRSPRSVADLEPLKAAAVCFRDRVAKETTSWMSPMHDWCEERSATEQLKIATELHL